MNKIYKIIWSKVKNCYVVVSEITKNNRKGTTVKSGKAAALLAAMLLIHGAFIQPAEAAGEVVWAPANSTATGTSDENAAHGSGSVAGGSGIFNAFAWGTNAKATGKNSLAWGSNAKASAENAMALGPNTTASANTGLATGDSTIAVSYTHLTMPTTSRV